jgi:hypothetical protein
MSSVITKERRVLAREKFKARQRIKHLKGELRYLIDNHLSFPPGTCFSGCSEGPIDSRSGFKMRRDFESEISTLEARVREIDQEIGS